MERNHLIRRREGGTSYLTDDGYGFPVLFLHGIPGSAYTWEPVALRLRDQFRVIVPDLRGFGDSAPSPDYYMEGQARAVKRLLDALDIKDCALVAHDFGGPVGLTFMRLFSESVVCRLVLSNTNLFTDTYIPAPLRLAKIPLLSTIFFYLIAGNRLGLWLMYRSAVQQKQTATWTKFQRHLTPMGMRMTRRIFQRSLADLEANYHDLEQMLSGLNVPTLILWGENDPFFSVDVGERTQSAFPDAELVVLDQTGHFVPEERPAEVTSALVSFLSDR